jgi:hypothetical protein
LSTETLVGSGINVFASDARTVGKIRFLDSPDEVLEFIDGPDVEQTIVISRGFPGEWERLRADHALVRPAIEELLRFITPIRAMRRTATSAVEVHVRTTRAGDKVVL